MNAAFRKFATVTAKMMGSSLALPIRSFTVQRARALRGGALSMEDGFAIHRLLNGALEEAGV
jgi:hypothetical protein